MQYLIHALDGANKLERRMEVRPRHLEGMKKLGEHVICAGGLLDEQGRPKGSALIVEFAEEHELNAYLEAEPYIQEKVWETVEVTPMNVVIVNGKTTGR